MTLQPQDLRDAVTQWLWKEHKIKVPEDATMSALNTPPRILVNWMEVER